MTKFNLNLLSWPDLKKNCTQTRDFWTYWENRSTRTNPLKCPVGSTHDPTHFCKRKLFFFIFLIKKMYFYLFERNIQILMISLGRKRIKISFMSCSLMACDLLIISIILVASKTTFSIRGKKFYSISIFSFAWECGGFDFYLKFVTWIWRQCLTDL